MSWSAFGAAIAVAAIAAAGGLNPLYIVECFRSYKKADEDAVLDGVLIHCISWNAFGVDSTSPQ